MLNKNSNLFIYFLFFQCLLLIFNIFTPTLALQCYSTEKKKEIHCKHQFLHDEEIMGEIMKCYTALCFEITNKIYKIKKGCVEPMYGKCRPLMCGFNYHDEVCNLCSGDNCNLNGSETIEFKNKIEKNKEEGKGKTKQLPIDVLNQGPLKDNNAAIVKPKEKIINETKNYKGVK
uniref:Uncharacterized protein n=1 Tax=Meloidogyne enterolobii TaxID=390850 RepID=A0A6V7VWE0_MELEN|nr:unnamed protein product [Meloidogyne enterolobii]